MPNIDICYICEVPGNLVMCDGCDRSVHTRCFHKPIDMKDDFYCGYCYEPLPQKLVSKNIDFLNLSEYFKGLKIEARRHYRENIDEFISNCRERSRNASSNKKIRDMLLREQDEFCAGLLKGNIYSNCKNRATECDHIIELRHGGRDNIENFQMLCTSCHCEKTAKNYGRKNRVF